MGKKIKLTKDWRSNVAGEEITVADDLAAFLYESGFAEADDSVKALAAIKWPKEVKKKK